MSYIIPGPNRQFAPVSTTKKVPLGVEEGRITTEVGGIGNVAVAMGGGVVVTV